MSENLARMKIEEAIKNIGNKRISDFKPEEITEGKKLLNRFINDNGMMKIPKVITEELEHYKELLCYFELIFLEANESQLKFDEIDSCFDLYRYLLSKSKINKLREGYVSHYTSFEAAKNILESKKFRLSNPSSMNDGLEFNSPEMDASKLYFASFTLDNNENMGMWSMYGQPWEQGVKISIPKDAFLEWKNQIEEVYTVGTSTRQDSIDNRIRSEQFRASITRVAYVEWTEDNNIAMVSCGERSRNSLLKRVDYKLLTGMIKDAAWSYEKEIRLRVDLYEKIKSQKIEISIPNDIIESMIIITGPRFDRYLSSKEFISNAMLKKSVFSGKLNYIYCDKCDRKKD